MNKTKILYVTTVSGTINAFLVPHIKMLLENHCQVDVACKITVELNNEVIQKQCKIFDINFSRSIWGKNNISSYKVLKRLISSECYDIVHVHTPIASTLVRLACRKNKSIRVIYTAHGFHFLKGGPFLNWLFFYPIERWLSKYTDTLITINNEDYELAKRRFKAKNIIIMNGVGVDKKKINSIQVNSETKREEIGVKKNSFILLSVGELNNNKNQKVVIKAISDINSDSIEYVICGKGKNLAKLEKLACKLNIRNKIHFLGYRNDVFEIMHISNVLISSSRREGLPVNVIEAMFSNKQVIATKIRGHVDLLNDKDIGLLYNYGDIDSLKKLIIEAFKKYEVSGLNDLVNYNIDDYDIIKVLESLKNVYFQS